MNWSEKVEDLVDSGQTDAAISYLETLISELQTLISPNSQSQLASALLQLSQLYSSKGFSLKSDQLSSRAAAIKLRSHSSTGISSKNDVIKVSDSVNPGCDGPSSSRADECTHIDEVGSVAKSIGSDNVPTMESDDDWEALLDGAPDEFLFVSPGSPPEPDVSKLSLSDTKPEVPKRRGRGTFTYRKHGLYSDQQADDCGGYESPNEVDHDKPEKVAEARNSIYGTHHVLVLDGFGPKTTTSDLEKLYVDFRDRGFAIRWVNDTLALAVFRTPAIAREALDGVRCSFSVRMMEEEDSIISSISVKDLDPPRPRPKTSARTAQRLIAQELGVKLPSTFGSRELRSQEDARRSRIVSRQNLRDEAWGPDETKPEAKEARKGL